MESTESDSDFGSEDSFEESNTYTLLPSYDPDDPSSLGGKEEQLELPVNSFSEIDLDAAVLAQLAGSLPSFSPVNESRTRNERAPLDLLGRRYSAFNNWLIDQISGSTPSMNLSDDIRKSFDRILLHHVSMLILIPKFQSLFKSSWPVLRIFFRPTILTNPSKTQCRMVDDLY